MNEPVVYFKPGCPFGIKLRIALTLHRVPHRSVRFRHDEEGAARVRAVNDGNEISPTVHIAGRWLTNPGWREVREAATGGTPSRRWPTALVLAATAVLLAGCGSDDPEAKEAPDDTVSSSATSPSSEAPPVVSPLEGSWQAGPVSLAESEATVRGHGLGQWVDEYRANAPFSEDTVLMLTVEDGAWDLYGASGGGEPQPIDYDAEYEIDGDTVVFHHSDGSNTFRWEVQDDILRLHFVKSTLPGYHGIPDEVFQRALYMTEPFTRQD